MSLTDAIKANDFEQFKHIINSNPSILDKSIYDIFRNIHEMPILMVHYILNNSKNTNDVIINISRTQNEILFWQFVRDIKDTRMMKLLLYCLILNNADTKLLECVYHYSNEKAIDDYMFYEVIPFIDKGISKWIKEKYEDRKANYIINAFITVIIIIACIVLAILTSDKP